MKNSPCPVPEFQVVPETEVENLMNRDSERILKESGKPRLNFNPSFTNGINSESRHGTETLVPQGPLILGGGTTSESPSITFVQDFGPPPFSKENTFLNQEPRATATATTTTHQTTAALQVGKKTSSLKRSAVPNDDFSTNIDVFLILPCCAEKNSSEIKQIIANEKLKLCRSNFYNEIFRKVDIKIAYSNSKNIKKLIMRTKL